MKTIAFCLFKYFPYGGMERDFLRIALECQKLGAKVRVYTTKWEGEVPDGFDVRILQKQGFSNHTRIFNFSKLIQQHLQVCPVDLVVGFNKMPGLDIYFAADVCFARKLSSKSPLKRFLPRYNNFLKLEESVFSENSKTKIMCLLQERAKEYQDFYRIDDSRIEVLPLALDKNFAKDADSFERDKIRVQFGFDTDMFVIAQVASAFHTKGVDRVFESMAELPDKNVHYLIIGAGEIEKYKKLAAKYALDGRVTFTGGRSDIAALLTTSDLLVHPARTEAAGISLLEALAVKLPVICTAACGYAPIIREAGGVILPEPFSQIDLNRELSRCLNRETLLNMKAELKSTLDDLHLSGMPEAAAQFIMNNG